MSQEAKQFFSLDRSGFEEAVEALHALSGMLLFEFARQEELSLTPSPGSPETLRKVKNINWLTGSSGDPKTEELGTREAQWETFGSQLTPWQGYTAAMGKLLEKAMEEASRLPESEQEKVGAWLLEELASERRWDELFRRSGSAIERMADEALRDEAEGRTEPLDPEAM